MTKLKKLFKVVLKRNSLQQNENFSTKEQALAFCAFTKEYIRRNFPDDDIDIRITYKGKEINGDM